MNTKNAHAWVKRLLLISFSLVINTVFAIDNPDVPDLIGEFETREKIYLKTINNPRNGLKGYLIAYDDYLKFLDDELNRAYHLIKSKLSTERQQELKGSQRNWIKIRNTEFELIKTIGPARILVALQAYHGVVTVAQ